VLDQLPQAIALDEGEMARFREHTRDIIRQFARSRPDGRLLSLNSQTDKRSFETMN
jgi:hypothetical protein